MFCCSFVSIQFSKEEKQFHESIWILLHLSCELQLLILDIAGLDIWESLCLELYKKTPFVLTMAQKQLRQQVLLDFAQQPPIVYQYVNEKVAWDHFVFELNEFKTTHSYILKNQGQIWLNMPIKVFFKPKDIIVEISNDRLFWNIFKNTIGKTADMKHVVHPRGTIQDLLTTKLAEGSLYFENQSRHYSCCILLCDTSIDLHWVDAEKGFWLLSAMLTTCAEGRNLKKVVEI